jgi:hypothetical protein
MPSRGLAGGDSFFTFVDGLAAIVIMRSRESKTIPRAARGFHVRLHIAGDGPNSTRAAANLGELCRKHLDQPNRTEIVDVTREPERSLTDNVLPTPTLLKVARAPQRQMVGNLSDTATVLLNPGLQHPA